LPKEIIERKKIEFIQLINEKIQNGEDISNIMEIFDKVFFSENQEKRVSFVDTTKIKYQFESLNLQVLAFGILLDNIIEIDTLIKEQEDRLSTLKEAIKQNEKELDLLLENKEKNSNKIAILESEIENFDKNINDNRLLIKDTEKEIHQISMRTHKEDVLNEKISTCEKTILVCQESIDITKIKKREELEKNVNEKLNLLIKDSYDAAHLKVYEDFTINLFDKNDKKMDILSSSSGQKQIIATALIWAISEYANTNMPMIVDTPLGRLDDKNQKLLLDNFYPNVAKQVIMLPTPSELKAEGFKNIINNATIFKLSSNGSIATVERV
jgi:DNA sulfur modification protein DndD